MIAVIVETSAAVVVLMCSPCAVLHLSSLHEQCKVSILDYFKGFRWAQLELS